ncbi:MAG: GGDEF domain-containing protein [Acidobacteriota bacterium]
MSMRLTTNDPGRLFESPHLPRVWAIAILVAALLAIFALDRSTGAAPLQHLYYLPIIMAGVVFGTTGGVGSAFAAILLYHLANHAADLRFEQSDVVQVVLFIAVGAITARLRRDAQRFRALAMTDDLTGLHNLRSFDAALTRLVASGAHAGTPLSVLVLDVDRLKSLNDVHGHSAGADAVRTVGHILAARLPATAVACRYGGDEFVVAVPNCSVDEAAAIANDMRQSINAASPVLAGLQFPSGALSISVGLACERFDPDHPGTPFGDRDDLGEALFLAADAALYRAKGSGRNHVCVA